MRIINLIEGIGGSAFMAELLFRIKGLFFAKIEKG